MFQCGGLTRDRRYHPGTRREAELAAFDYIETFYNSRRRHSSLGYLSPVEHPPFEQPATRHQGYRSNAYNTLDGTETVEQIGNRIFMKSCVPPSVN